eukprot:Clim_evm1s92 gene=Clim_evmTU1s92
MDPISKAAERTPVFDHHAHPITHGWASRSLAQYLCERDASDPEVTTSVAYKRATRELARRKLTRGGPVDQKTYAQKAFDEAKIGALLLDDLFMRPSERETSEYHAGLTVHGTCGRIVRLEALIADWVEQNLPTGSCPGVENLKQYIADACAGEQVSGLKSAICYRTGLAVATQWTWEDAQSALQHYWDRCIQARCEGQTDGLPAVGLLSDSRDACLQEKALLDLVLIWASSGNFTTVPVQIHTGFGDRDLSLVNANPALLQPYLEHLNKLKSPQKVVLLHASHPYSSEASYLASVFDSVYLDCSLAIPLLSHRMMEHAIQELMGLCPLDKLMFSTDAHHSPELFLLGTIDGRRVLEKVLKKAVQDGDLSPEEAAQTACDILWNNACRLYGFDRNTKNLLPLYDAKNLCGDLNNSDPMSFNNASRTSNWDTLRMCITDMGGLLRARAFDRDYVERKLVVEGGDNLFEWCKPIGLTKALLVVPYFGDVPCANKYDYGPVGEVDMMPAKDCVARALPDLGNGTLKDTSVMVMADMLEKKTGVPADACPRNFLRKMVRKLKDDHGLTALIGLEHEFILYEKADHPNASEANFVEELNGQFYLPVDLCNYASTDGLNRTYAFWTELKQHLKRNDIIIEQYHVESSPGQFELITPPKDPMSAVDDALYLRECIRALAIKHGMYASFLPQRVKAMGAGNGAHLHLSVWKDGENCFGSSNPEHSRLAEHVVGGLHAGLDHISFFTLGSDESYRRLLPGFWSGAYQIYGEENKEAPLRGCGNNVEVKTSDATSNLFLSVGAMLALSCKGLTDKAPMPANTLEVPPADSPIPRMPQSREEAYKAMLANKPFWEENMGPVLLEIYSVTQTQKVIMEPVPKDQLGFLRY